MASSYGSSKTNHGLPAMLKCDADGKLEKRDMFSHNMLKKRSLQANARLTCRKHTTSTVMELTCTSCRKIKSIGQFSNAERKASGSQRCRACIEWTEGDDITYTPLPAPNGVRDYHEMAVYKGNETLMGDSDEEYEDDAYVTESQNSICSADYNASSVPSSVPSSVRGPKLPTGVKAEFLTANTLQNFNNPGSPYPVSSHGNQSYHPSSAPTDSLSTYGTNSTARPRQQVGFKAYGIDGQVQSRVQSVTAPSDSSVNAPSNPRRKGWAKAPTRKTAPSLPRHMEYENPETVGHNEYDDDDSPDEC